MKQTLSHQLRSRLSLKGKSIRSWAIGKGFNVKTTYSALNGRLNGSRGGKLGKEILDAAKKAVS